MYWVHDQLLWQLKEESCLTKETCLCVFQNVKGVAMPMSSTEPLPVVSFLSRTFSPTQLSTTDALAPTTIISNISGPGDLRCTYQEDFKRILLPAIYSSVFLLGLPLNAVVILKIWRSRPHLTRNNIYMLNLATADFLYVMSLPLLIYNYASHDYWPFGELACKMVRFQFYR